MSQLAMVVEGEPLVRSFIRYVLERENFQVIDTASQHDAWELYQKNADTLNLIIIDQDLRPYEGVDFYQKIRKQDKNINIILMATTFDTRMIQLYTDPHGYILNKPFPVENLKRLLYEPTYENYKNMKN